MGWTQCRDATGDRGLLNRPAMDLMSTKQCYEPSCMFSGMANELHRAFARRAGLSTCRTKSTAFPPCLRSLSLPACKDFTPQSLKTVALLLISECKYGHSGFQKTESN